MINLHVIQPLSLYLSLEDDTTEYSVESRTIIARNLNGNYKRNFVNTYAPFDMLMLFDMAVPDGAYITSARLELPPVEAVNDDSGDNISIYINAVGTDMLNDGKKYNSKPEVFLNQMKSDASYKGKEYDPLKTKVGESLSFDVTALLPYEVNQRELFRGTLSFVVTATSMTTGEIEFYMGHSTFTVTFGGAGKLIFYFLLIEYIFHDNFF